MKELIIITAVAVIILFVVVLAITLTGREEKKTKVQKVYVIQDKGKSEETTVEEPVKPVDRLSELPSAESAKALREAKKAELKKAAFMRGKNSLISQLSDAIRLGKTSIVVTTPSYRYVYTNGYPYFKTRDHTEKYMVSNNLLEDLKKKGYAVKVEEIPNSLPDGNPNEEYTNIFEQSLCCSDDPNLEARYFKITISW